MNRKVNIRNYQPADKPAVLTLLELNIPRYFAESERDDLDKYLEHKTEKYFVAETAEQLIGAAGMNFDFTTRTGIISWDIIHPDFQGIGIGRQLLTHRINLFRSMKDIEKIIVRTSQLSYLFYEKNNFTLKETAKDFWAQGIDRYDMEYEPTQPPQGR